MSRLCRDTAAGQCWSWDKPKLKLEGIGGEWRWRWRSESGSHSFTTEIVANSKRLLRAVTRMTCDVGRRAAVCGPLPLRPARSSRQAQEQTGAQQASTIKRPAGLCEAALWHPHLTNADPAAAKHRNKCTGRTEISERLLHPSVLSSVCWETQTPEQVELTLDAVARK